jgi:membrane protease YdiL (CAAX protease family)
VRYRVFAGKQQIGIFLKNIAMACQPEEDITFACQECGKSIALPAYYAGRVGDCPECGSYVDVPRESEQASDVETRVASAESLDPRERTKAQLWLEVLAVLCLAYFPWLYGALAITESAGPVDYSLVSVVLYRIMTAAKIAVPLLVILALAKERWSSFGIVRPRWAADIVIGCLVWYCARFFRTFVASFLPLAALRASHAHVADRIAPEGLMGCALVLVAIAASASVEELVFRGYFIPRFERLLRSTWLAVLIVTAMFGVCHLYQGTISAILVAADGFVYAMAFCFLRRLWPVCVAHTLGNAVIYLGLIR